ncbi:uncharacterized protein LOC118757381, partial [Rhagoletis pomonella]|uniref:uncharacterized protein LOC118757381 n=1 Tax=Rhagoletis pomonella TaxID=28610 RepID=UPI00177B4D2C
MAKIQDLNIEELKQELEKRNLATSGRKVELLSRLREAMEDKSAALFVALKGPAAEILQTIPDCERNSYDALMGAVERRYGSEHRRQIYQMELENRCQKANETLQEFASEIERLAHLAIGDASGEHLERVKIQRFINGMRDMYTKRETYANPKPFSETVSYAQT